MTKNTGRCLAFVLAAAALAAPVLVPQALAQEGPVDVLAAQVRQHGHECVEPQGATRDGMPTADKTTWILRCKNASYRVQLSPNRNAVVERIQ
jgi:hypothetical protein